MDDHNKTTVALEQRMPENHLVRSLISQADNIIKDTEFGKEVSLPYDVALALLEISVIALRESKDVLEKWQT